MDELIQTIRGLDGKTRRALARQLEVELDCGCLEAYDELGEFDAELTSQYVRLNKALAVVLREASS